MHLYIMNMSWSKANGAKLIGRRFIIQIEDDPKHTARATQEILKVKKWNILQWPSQSPDFNPIEHAFHLKTKLKAERPTNKQQLKSACSKGLAKHHKRKKKNSLWWCLWVPDLRQSVPAKDSQQNIKNEHFITLICHIKFEPLKMGGGVSV